MRFSSGTIGFAMMAAAASTAGIGGIVVSPAPSLAPRSRCEEVPTRRVTVEPESARADPNAVEASRLDARDTVDMLLPTPAGWVATDLSAANGAMLLETVLEGVLLGTVRPGAWAAPSGEPQTSQ